MLFVLGLFIGLILGFGICAILTLHSREQAVEEYKYEVTHMYKEAIDGKWEVYEDVEE